MSHHASRSAPTVDPRRQRRGALPWVFFGFLAVAGFFLFTEHRAHLLGALPFVLLALCPLMHFFHGGHGGHRHPGHVPAGSGGVEGDTTGQDRVEPAPSTPPALRQPHQH